MEVGRITNLAEERGQSGKIKDEHGYYKVRLSKLNGFTRAGIFYRVKNIDTLLGPGTLVHTRIKKGMLKSEYDHPKTQGLPKEEAYRRTIEINSDRVCGYIRKIEFVKTNKVEAFGLPVIYVDGWVKPYGPKAEYLAQALEDPYMNVLFSIRSLAKQRRINKILVRDVALVSTWDYVPEPGVIEATSWDAAGLESYGNDVIINDDDFEEVVHALESMTCQDGKCALDTLSKVKEIIGENKYDVLFKF